MIYLAVFIGKISISYRALKSELEKADERTLFNINQSLQIENDRKIVVAATDNDILTTLLYHY